VARPQPPTAAQIAAAPVTLKPGKHLAVALIPEGGATKKHPAVFVIKGNKGEKPVVLVSDKSPDPKNTPTAQAASTGGGTTTPSATSTTPAPSSSTTSSAPVEVAAFNFALPDKPRANDSQALAVNHQDGGIKYSVAYSLVTVTGGKPVDSRNTAYAFANCNACTTVAVSFQLVLIVGQSDTIAPLNFAGALNVNCPSCITTAIADQIVLSIKSVPSDELLQRLTEELKKLDAISALGAAGTPAEVAKQVADVQNAIQKDLADSGLATNPPKTTPTSTTPSSTTPTSTTSTTPNSTSTTGTTPDSTSTTSTAPDSTTTTPTSTTPAATTPTDTTPTTTEPAPTSTTSTTTTP
jgi:putative peptide zinc metalloprotease protein